MQETTGDIFNQQCDALCFTSNGVLNSKNSLVMGAGIAKQVKDRWPELPGFFGARVKAGGNHVYINKDKHIVSFPTKYHWRDPSDLALIEQSARELVALTDKMGWKIVCLTRPGTGLGSLLWDDVKPIIAPILDNRFVVVNK